MAINCTISDTKLSTKSSGQHSLKDLMQTGVTLFDILQYTHQEAESPAW